jgi:hypothetical protein
MSRTALLKYLRIAWTASFAIAAMLLITLWVQSYSHLTTIQVAVTASARYYLHSYSGTLALQVWERSFLGNEYMPFFRESDLASWLTPNACFKLIRTSGLGISAISISYWLLTAGTLTLAPLAWLPWRFTLRTLLAATGLVAVALGTIVVLCH